MSRKLSHGSIITPTCPLSLVAIATGSEDEDEEETPPSLHDSVLRFLPSCDKDKVERGCGSVSHLGAVGGGTALRREQDIPAVTELQKKTSGTTSNPSAERVRADLQAS